NGSSWVTVGTAGFSADVATWPSITIDKNGTPYVGFTDSNNGKGATVMKYNGSNWVLVGSAAFSAGWADNVSVVTDNAGTPYVVFIDRAHTSGATVME